MIVVKKEGVILEHTEHQLYQDENDFQRLENLALEIAS